MTSLLSMLAEDEVDGTAIHNGTPTYHRKNASRCRTAVVRATILNTDRLHQLGVDMSTRRCKDLLREAQDFILPAVNPPSRPPMGTMMFPSHYSPSPPHRLPPSLLSSRNRIPRQFIQPDVSARRIPTPCNSCQRSDGAAERFHSHDRRSSVIVPGASTPSHGFPLNGPRNSEEVPSTSFSTHMRIRYLRTSNSEANCQMMLSDELIETRSTKNPEGKRNEKPWTVDHNVPSSISSPLSLATPPGIIKIDLIKFDWTTPCCISQHIRCWIASSCIRAKHLLGVRLSHVFSVVASLVQPAFGFISRSAFWWIHFVLVTTSVALFTLSCDAEAAARKEFTTAPSFQFRSTDL